MPVKFEIREDGHIIYAHVSNPWTMADYEINVASDLAYRNSVSFPVHTVLNVSEIYSIPKGVLSLTNSPTIRHPRSGVVAVVGTNTVIRVLAETIMRITNFTKISFFENEEDAFAYVYEVMHAESAKASSSE